MELITKKVRLAVLVLRERENLKFFLLLKIN